MKKITVDELSFIAIRDIGSNAPVIYCTSCGKRIPPVLESGWMVEIPVNEDGVWMIVLCSDECLNRFRGNANVPKSTINRFLNERIESMRKL